MHQSTANNHPSRRMRSGRNMAIGFGESRRLLQLQAKKCFLRNNKTDGERSGPERANRDYFDLRDNLYFEAVVGSLRRGGGNSGGRFARFCCCQTVKKRISSHPGVPAQYGRPGERGRLRRTQHTYGLRRRCADGDLGSAKGQNMISSTANGKKERSSS